MNKREKKYYLEREVSWMYFNHRVLQEAQDNTVPILERFSFLGIYSNNLDEFFRVRVAILNRIIALKDSAFKNDREKAMHTLSQINDLYKKYAVEFDETFNSLKKEMETHHIYILDEKQIDDEQRKQIHQMFIDKLSFHLYPRLFLRNPNFKDLDDENVYLAVRQISPTGKKDYALLEIPADRFGRFIELESGEGNKKIFMFLDDVIRICLPYIFAGQTVAARFEAYAFKLTKDAEIDIDISLEGAINKVDKAIKQRKWGQPVRFIYDRNMPGDLLKQIRTSFNIRDMDNVIAGSCYHNLKDLISFPDCRRKELKYPEWKAISVPKIMKSDSVMEVIRQQDLLLHYPYHHFSNYIRLLREAAVSKKIHAIKITLYRLAKHSAVAEALICAAKNGKKVTVVIELLARFDEASNIYWTKKMQGAGITVILGIEGLKIHSKLTLIKGNNISVACINTGNFHEGNAKAYTDLSLMTARRSIVSEVDGVFQFIQKPYLNCTFRKLLVSPINMREKIKLLIDAEIRNAKCGKEAFFKCKLNHVIDSEMVDKLYEAAAAGVKIDLLVRGNCSIIAGVSANISVKGIIDRYLEHSRVFIFCNGGKGKYYIGSADWAYRNFNMRVEVLTPILDKKLQKELDLIVDYGLKDNRKARIVDGTGKDLIPSQGDAPFFRSQEELYKYYSK
ncbi:MAG: RNA degradosome polyphosphate kinase [Dysgonamonadaceae bacterium]|jgi:polyphosphate kinase|nr:RNA degradosome polyphosphate kinase [Dysgonamonadaceae bacterium]